MNIAGRRIAVALGAASAAGLVGVAAWMTQAAEAADAESTPNAQTAEVEERTLRLLEDVTGNLGHGEERPISTASPGTLTRLPDVGTNIERGEALFDINDEPTILLYGEMPAWRTLEEGAEGRDVEQLEKNLRDLGYGDALTVDETWDAATTAAVKAWQEDVGAEPDGRVDLGEVVFEPGAVIVAGLDGARGANVGPGSPVLRVTGEDRVITAGLSGSQRDGVEVGDTVEVELGDGSRVEATIDEIDSVPTTAEDGSQTYGLRLTLDEVADEAFNGPVAIQLVRQERADVLAVPVSALLALLEGGYAVERLGEDGTIELVTVEVGLFTDGWVEVEGDLEAGDAVVIP